MEIQRKRKLIFLTAICLVLLLCIILGSLDCCFNISNVAVANQTKSSQIGEVLLKNYETRSDGKVFDSKQLSNLFKLLTNSKGSSLKDVADLGLRDSNYFRSVNGGQDIIIELNGLKWYAAYLSSTNDAKSDVVLTLWLADSTQLPINYQKVVWSAYGEDSNGNYPANMYGTSMVRTFTLNNGGSYATGYNNPLNDAYQQDASNPFAIFTMKDISGSLFKYVETPLNVAWQERLSAKENNLKVDGGTFEYNHANDAYSLTMTDFNAGRDYQDKTNYDAWKTDRVWLPSMAETGWKQDSAYDYIGLWKTSSAMRSNVKANEHTMLRTARGINYSDISRLRADGKDASAGSANEAAAIRPAFHLNLTQAEKDSIASLDAPSQLTGVYSGLEQTIADAEGIDEATWYDSEVYGDSSKVKVEYFTSDGALMQGSTPKDAGTYKVRYTIIDTANYSWSGSADNTDKIRESTFVIGQKQIDFPKFYNDESTKVYDGGKNIAFRVASNYDKTALKITFNGEEIPTNCIVTVTEVGKYQLDVTLKDSKNYILKSTDTKMEFEVTKFEIELKLTDTVSGSSELNIFSGDEKNFNLEIAVGKGVHENTENPITVPVVIKASAPELSTEEVSEIINLTSSDTLRAVKISASDLVATTYKLSATTTNPNYSVKINPEASLKVSDASSGTAVRWQLYADGAPVNGKYMNAEIGETSVEFTSKLTYDAKQYEFKVTSPDGYVLDEEFGINGYETVATDASNGAVGKNADSYKTKIRLEESATGVKTEYEIEWEITKAKFDLTNVKWR
ncbi:MAG: hypothetical protein OSJ74_09350, partial [Clostridia bacterium]|nr:hypothetical protein [Clostridia bacterium]